MKIQWISLSRFCDWDTEYRNIPKQMIAEVFNSGLLKEGEWIKTGIDNEEQLPYSKEQLSQYLDKEIGNEEIYLLTLGGSTPDTWEMSLGLSPFVPAINQARGYNILDIQCQINLGDEELITLFKKVHQGNETEFAFIHPYKRWDDLSDTVFGEYGEPITFRPAFSGVFWAIFFGKGHLELFDTEKLKQLNAYQVEWINDGLFVRVSKHLSEVENPEVEEEMFRLTEEFKKALL